MQNTGAPYFSCLAVRMVAIFSRFQKCIFLKRVAKGTIIKMVKQVSFLVACRVILGIQKQGRRKRVSRSKHHMEADCIVGTYCIIQNKQERREPPPESRSSFVTSLQSRRLFYSRLHGICAGKYWWHRHHRIRRKYPGRWPKAFSTNCAIVGKDRGGK